MLYDIGSPEYLLFKSIQSRRKRLTPFVKTGKGNGDSLYYLLYFYICLKFSKVKKNIKHQYLLKNQMKPNWQNDGILLSPSFYYNLFPNDQLNPNEEPGSPMTITSSISSKHYYSGEICLIACKFNRLPISFISVSNQTAPANLPVRKTGHTPR